MTLRAIVRGRLRASPPRCRAKTPDGTPCRSLAGENTSHPGKGRCWIHEPPDRADTIRRYRGLRGPTIRKHLRQMQDVEHDVLNLIPEVQLIRAVVIDYVDNYDELNTALLAWYHDNKQKPKRVLDLKGAIDAIEAISRVVERVHRIQERGSISLDTFRRVLEQMGIIVAKHVADGFRLECIEREWSQLALDAKSSVSALPPAESETAQVPDVVGRARAARQRNRQKMADVDNRDDT